MLSCMQYIIEENNEEKIAGRKKRGTKENFLMSDDKEYVYNCIFSEIHMLLHLIPFSFAG